MGFSGSYKLKPRVLCPFSSRANGVFWVVIPASSLPCSLGVASQLTWLRGVFLQGKWDPSAGRMDPGARKQQTPPARGLEVNLGMRYHSIVVRNVSNPAFWDKQPYEGGSSDNL